MVLSTPRPQEKEFNFIKPAVPACPDGTYYTVNRSKTNYQLMPRGTSLIELPLTQPYVWVHYKINKLPVPEWGAELSQLRPAEVKEFQAWCLWAGELGARVWRLGSNPSHRVATPECYGLEGSTRPLAKLTLVLGLDGALMSLLQVMI